MGENSSDVRDNPRSGLIILTTHLMIVPFGLYMLWKGAALDNVIGWVLFIALLGWLGFCFYAIRLEILALTTGRRPAKTCRLQQPIKTELLQLYSGTPPYAIKPESLRFRKLLLNTLTVILCVVLLTPCAIGILVTADDGDVTLYLTLLGGAIVVIVGSLLLKFYRAITFPKLPYIAITAPATPGSSFDAIIRIPEAHNIKRIAVDLVMEEAAQGWENDSYKNEKAYVVTESVSRLLQKHILEGAVETRVKLELPWNTMVTFKSKSNQINWFFLVRLVLTNDREVEQRFPLAVIPPGLVYEGSDASQKQTA